MNFFLLIALFSIIFCEENNLNTFLNWVDKEKSIIIII